VLKRATAAGAALVVLAACILTLIALARGPSGDRACSTDLTRLLVVPDGSDWTITGAPENERMYGEEGLLGECAAFYSSPAGAEFQYVLQFNSLASAVSAYQVLRQAEFRPDLATGETWEAPTAGPDAVLHADQDYVACAQQGERSICRAIGRYGACIVILTRVFADIELEVLPDDALIAAGSQVDQALGTFGPNSCSWHSTD